MSIIVKMRRQRAVWWQRNAQADQYGSYSFAAPVEILCRWDDVSQEFLAADGEKRSSRSMVYTDRVMLPGDRLMLGELDSNTPTDPLSVTNTFEVRRFDKTPNLRATETLFTAYL